MQDCGRRDHGANLRDLRKGRKGPHSTGPSALHIRGVRAELRLELDVARAWALLLRFRSALSERLGSRLGTAIDALAASTGNPRIQWDVYSGLEFEWDSEPDSDVLGEASTRQRALVDAISRRARGLGPGAMGDRSSALGNRSRSGRAVQCSYARRAERDKAARGLPTGCSVLPARRRRESTSTTDFDRPLHALFPPPFDPIELARGRPRRRGTARVQTVTE